MSAAADRIVEQLKLLTPEEQDEVSVHLDDMLDPDGYDPDDDPDFQAELERRLNDPSPNLSWEEVKRSVESELAAIRKERGERDAG